MKKFTIHLATSLFFLLFFVSSLNGIDKNNTRMMAQPAISSKYVAFIYAEDLWIANIDGSQPRRLTVDEGIESNPFFSPDGSLIAFSAQYDGNTDVFVIPVEGGVPARLTWHPSADIVRGFTPEGKSILFLSQRSSFTNRYLQLFTVGTGGGFPEKLRIPNAYFACYSPDGNSMAYTPIAPAYQQWKNYRGGRISNIWICSLTDYSVIKIPQPENGCNDSDPMWIRGKIYFLSDREQHPLNYEFINDVHLLVQLRNEKVSRQLISPYSTVLVIEYSGDLGTIPSPAIVDDAFPTILDPKDARINGTTLKYAYNPRWEKGRGYNIYDWYKNDETVEWRFSALRDGEFDVELRYGAPDGCSGNEYMIRMGEQELRSTVQSTGDWYEYRNQIAGSIRIKANTENVLVVQPVKTAGCSLMNLQSIRLLPIVR